MAAESSQNSAFTELATVRDPDGPRAHVTARNSDGRVSFRLFRQFTEGGQERDTHYFGRRHIPGLRRLLDDLEQDLELHEDRERERRRSA